MKTATKVVRSPIQKLSIGVPVYNELEHVEGALKALLGISFPVEIEVIVVDDRSTDGTWELLRSLSLPPNVRLVRKDTNEGKGSAVRRALELATGEVFVPFDADLEYDPADIPRLLQPILERKTDVAFGTREFGAHTAYNFWYVVGNKFVCLWTNVLFNCYISDLANCYKMARTEIFRSLNLTSKGFTLEAEITAKVLSAGHRIYEMPISYVARSREEGKKVKWTDGAKALWTVLRVRALDR
jgi:glycosyltransferase involved in cell wall biosynthesis